MPAPWQLRRAFEETIEGLDLEIPGDPTDDKLWKKGQHQLEALVLFAYELGWQVGADVEENADQEYSKEECCELAKWSKRHGHQEKETGSGTRATAD